jgi:molybdopterin converting factor small subunit
MKVRVLFFGATAEAANTRSAEFDARPGDTAEALLEALGSRFPALSGRELLIAVNEEYAVSETRLHEGDEIAVFTAVSGG